VRWYIISSNEYLVSSLTRYLDLNFGIELLIIPKLSKKYSNNTLEILQLEYRSICDSIDELRLYTIRDTVILIDEGSYLIGANSGMESFQGELFNALIFTYPESYFCLLKAGVNENVSKNSTIPQNFEHYHYFDLLRLKSEVNKIKEHIINRYSPLFDPTGIRNSVKQKFHELGVSSKCKVNLDRKKTALVIDDEKGYSYLYSYIGYLTGYRVWNINSLGMMEKVLKDKTQKYAFSFEDIFLSFIDKQRFSLAFLEERDEKFGTLKKIKKRIFISVNHPCLRKRETSQTPEDVVEANDTYKKVLKKARNNIISIDKPVPSIYEMFKKCGLSPEIEWPLFADPSSGNHSSPGKVVLIAERMLFRAEAILKNSKSPDDYLVGAMIAREVQELLANSTPTLAIRALMLREQLEVSYECFFHGIQYKLNFKHRIRALEKEVKAICLWYGPGKCIVKLKKCIKKIKEVVPGYKIIEEALKSLSASLIAMVKKIIYKVKCTCNKISKVKSIKWLITPVRPIVIYVVNWLIAKGELIVYHCTKYFKRSSELNALSSIVGTLTLLYRNSNQFDEDTEAVNYSRWLEGISTCFNKYYLWLFYPARWYIEKLLNSTWFFVLAVMAWILVFAEWAYSRGAATYGMEGIQPVNNPTCWYYITHSIESMLTFSIQYEGYLRSQNNLEGMLLVALPMFVGLIHFGIFITHIYTKFLRK
jgi:hypothetical protein